MISALDQHFWDPLGLQLVTLGFGHFLHGVIAHDVKFNGM
jgi:hypothetical protein